MKVNKQEETLIRTIRKAGTSIPFILLHMSQLYGKQAEMDNADKRENEKEMRRRADLFWQAYNGQMVNEVKKREGNVIQLRPVFVPCETKPSMTSL